MRLRLRFLAIVSALVFVSGGVSAGQSPAVAAPLVCPPDHPALISIGVHGLGEGPDTRGVRTKSDTVNAVQDELREVAPNASIEVYNLPYDAELDFAEVEATEGLIPKLHNLVSQFKRLADDGTRRLTAYLEDVWDECPTQRVVLTGYSLGALVVDQYILDNIENATRDDNLRAVLLYADPLWWRDRSGEGNRLPAQGLAQAVDLDGGTIPPYPVGHPWVQAWCAPRDPVCGEGYAGLVGDVQQIERALYCLNRGEDCEHFSYAGNEVIKHGAQFLADRGLPAAR